MAALVLCLASFFILLQGKLVQPVECPCNNKELCNPVQGSPDKEVLGFMTSPYNWKQYNWSELTTVGLFCDMNDTELYELMCHAHANQVRLVANTRSQLLKLPDESSRQKFYAQLLEYVQKYFLDGINIDVEDPIINGSDEEALLTKSVREIFTLFKSNSSDYQVTFDFAWSPNCIDGRCYDYWQISQWTDFVIIMAYDERSQVFGSGTCLSGANSNFIKTQQGIYDYIKLGIQPHQLVLGLPWYGYDYPCVSAPEEYLPCEIPRFSFRGVNCSDGIGRQIGYSHIMEKYLPLSTTGVLYDTATESPFFTYVDQNDATHMYHQMWFDDPSSLSVKYNYARTMKLRGIAFWNIDALNYAGNIDTARKERDEMWNAIQSFLHD